MACQEVPLYVTSIKAKNLKVNSSQVKMYFLYLQSGGEKLSLGAHTVMNDKLYSQLEKTAMVGWFIDILMQMRLSVTNPF